MVGEPFVLMTRRVARRFEKIRKEGKKMIAIKVASNRQERAWAANAFTRQRRYRNSLN
jgi:hypothetical protein